MEIHNEHLIFGITRIRKSKSGGNDVREFASHAAAVVHHQAGRHRAVLTTEQSDVLQDSILVYPKGPLGERADHFSPMVPHCDMEDHEIHVDAKISLSRRREAHYTPRHAQECGPSSKVRLHKRGSATPFCSETQP